VPVCPGRERGTARAIQPAAALKTSERIEIFIFEPPPTIIARLSHLEGIFDYFHPETGIKMNACNMAMPKTAVVKTCPL
jgi:hypothetical protein